MNRLIEFTKTVVRLYHAMSMSPLTCANNNQLATQTEYDGLGLA